MVNIDSTAIFIVGNERYLKEKAIKEISSSLLDSSSGELDYKVLYGPDTTADEILDSASTIPFFSAKRLIVVKDFDRLPKEDLPRLLAYVKHPNQHTCLIMDIKDNSILEKEPSLNRYAKVLTFSGLEDAQVSKWITKYLSSNNKTIDEDALDILKELKGGDLMDLSQELEKLMTYSGRRKTITREDVENLVGKSALASAFDIADAIGERNSSKAIEIVYSLSFTGKKAHEMIGLLSWYFKRLLKAKTLLSKGQTEYSAAQNLRIPRRNAKDFFTLTSSYSVKEIESKMEILLEADLGIKRARFSPSLILEFAIMRLCL